MSSIFPRSFHTKFELFLEDEVAHFVASRRKCFAITIFHHDLLINMQSIAQISEAILDYIVVVF